MVILQSVVTRSPQLIPYARYTLHLRLFLHLFLSLVRVGFPTGLRPTSCRYTDYDTCWKVRGSNPGTRKIVSFPKTHIPALKPTQSPMKAVQCTRLSIKRTKPDVEHSPQSSSHVKNGWSHSLHGVDNDKFPFKSNLHAVNSSHVMSSRLNSCPVYITMFKNYVIT
jgi:hypothetical protein